MTSQESGLSQRVVRRERERGYTLILLAGAGAVLIAFTGLAVDVGSMELQKRRMQAAADAGAVGGILEILRGNTTSYDTYAKNDTAAQGFTDGANSTVVRVSAPPSSGAYVGKPGYVEVAISRPQNAYFMPILGIGPVTVNARSVAGPGSSGACVWVLDPSAAGAYHTDGQTTLTAACGMRVNSSDPVAIDNQGSTTMQNKIVVRGNYSNQGTLSPSPLLGAPAARDPLAGMAVPLQPGAPSGNTATVLQPGYYSSGIHIGASANVTLAPGLYYLNGDLWVGQDAQLTGTGVTVYLSGQVYGNHASVNLVAPTASGGGAIEGILIWSTLSGPSSQCVRLESDSALTLTGVVYCPQSQVYLESHSAGVAPYTEIVAKTVSFIGSTTHMAINADYSSLSHGNPIKDAALLAE